MHAITHQELEAPLLLASALLVQAAQAVAVERSLRRCSSVASTSATAASGTPASSPPAPSGTALGNPGSSSPGVDAGCPSLRARRGNGEHVAPLSSVPPVLATVTGVAPSKRKRTGGGSGSSTSGGGAEEPSVGLCAISAAATEHRSCARSWAEQEAAAVREIMEAFPRGWFRDSPRREEGEPATAIRESWVLLKKALHSKFVSGGADGTAAAAAVASAERNADAVVINPGELPLLLSLRVYELVVGGLAANLMEVEVRRREGGRDGSTSLELPLPRSVVVQTMV